MHSALASKSESERNSAFCLLNAAALQVNLRHLREDVALLAARLRQHKADVRLPGDLQDLTPQVGAHVIMQQHTT